MTSLICCIIIGIFRKDVEGGSINGIQFYEVSASEGEQSTVHTNVLVSTKDCITVIVRVIHC